MIYHCAPEPEDVLASRRLSDGRALAVFVNRVCEQSVERSRAVAEVSAGGETLVLSYERAEMRTREFVAGYSLCVTDDAGMPEKWRSLATRKSAKAAIKLFDSFKEGDDDRRRRQVEEHPGRRSTD